MSGGVAEAACPLDPYLGRDPRRWTGFAAEPEARLLGRCDFTEGEGRTILGEQRVSYRFRALRRDGFTDPFFCHFADGRLALIANDFWSLDPAQSAAVLEALGPPPHRLDARFRDSALPGADHVHPGRGLALCVMPETGLIARWAAFAPCPLADYRARYRVVDLAREFEDVGGG